MEVLWAVIPHHPTHADGVTFFILDDDAAERFREARLGQCVVEGRPGYALSLRLVFGKGRITVMDGE
jgi:hypothetical protein